MSKYHINPNTGMPGKCTAAPGNCPYGNEANHFRTYSEAFTVSQSKLEKSFNILPTNLNELDNETEEALANQEREQKVLEDNMSKIKASDNDLYKKKNEVANLTDPEVLLGIIDGRFDNKRDWGVVGAALRNKHLPKDYIDKILYEKLETNNPGLITRLLYNPQITTEDLTHVLENVEDEDTKLVAYMHPNLDKDIVLWNIENNDKISEYPYNGMLINPTHRQDPEIRDWSLQLLLKGIDPGFPKSRQIYNSY